MSEVGKSSSHSLASMVSPDLTAGLKKLSNLLDFGTMGENIKMIAHNIFGKIQANLNRRSAKESISNAKIHRMVDYQLDRYIGLLNNGINSYQTSVDGLLSQADQFIVDIKVSIAMLKKAREFRESIGEHTNDDTEAKLALLEGKLAILRQLQEDWKQPITGQVNGMTVNDMLIALRSLGIPETNEKNLSQPDIEKAFRKELDNGNTLQVDLENMIQGLGLEMNNLPQEIVKGLAGLLLITRHPTTPFQSLKINRCICWQLLPFVREKYKNVTGYSEGIDVYRKKFTEEFGVKENNVLEEIHPTWTLCDLLYIHSQIADKNTQFFKALDRQVVMLRAIVLTRRTSEIIGEVSKNLSNAQEIDLKAVENNVKMVMAILHYASGGMQFSQDNLSLWETLNEGYKKLLQMKVDSNSSVQDLIAKVFQENQLFIDDGLIVFMNIQGGAPYEDLMQQLYGRSKSEMEAIKAANREAVVTSIEHFASDLSNGGLITREMLSSLHMVNNRGITPPGASSLRREKWDSISFGRRKGLRPELVEDAVDDVLSRANKLLKSRGKRGPIADLKWIITVAKLHNDLLDIHPFADRNGSTCLLFVELMMAARGSYQPQPTRNNKYYEHLLNIFKNPIGVAIVAYEHYLIAHQAGSYQYQGKKLG